ncbi:MAG: heparinase II/III family protein, partial [Candidatus Latescibacteria bacterium]|nr:heparinase II/III family protein [Candidatus Latescibacterota bacterium]
MSKSIGSIRLSILLSVLLFLTATETFSMPPERHPLLLCEAEEWSGIRDNASRAPYAAWWHAVQGEADRAIGIEVQEMGTEVGMERRKTEYAKILAFAYAFTEEIEYAQKAAELLTSVAFPPDGGAWGEMHFEAEGAVSFFEAYDMLTEYALSNPAWNAAIRDKIYREAHRLMTTSELWYGFLKNNWQIRQYSALGMAAMVLSDYEGGDSTPDEWAEKARTEVLAALEYQVDAEGGYAEGPFYHYYAAELYLPYLRALKRFTGEDFLNREHIRNLHEWAVKIRLPNGLRPNTDDAHLTDSFGGVLTSVYPNDGVHLWDWEHTERLSMDTHYQVDALCLFDDRATETEPSWPPTQFLETAGDAVFRSDWSSDATYLLLRAEHDSARTQGGEHEHPDATSFILYAGGQMLATDGGYIRWDDHDLVNKAANHNLILVDGEGPRIHRNFLGLVTGVGEDAYLEHAFSTDFLDYAEVRTQYEAVQFRRSVFFPDKRFFVIVDSLHSTNGAHQYEWRLHGGEGDFELLEDGGRWTVGDMELEVCLAAPHELTFSEEQGIHSFAYRQQLPHTILKAAQQAEDTRFVTVLFPRKADEPSPDCAEMEVEGGVGMRLREGGRTSLVLTRTGEEALVPEWGVRTDGDRAFLSMEGDSLCTFSVQSGRLLEVNGAPVFSASDPVRLTIQTSARLWEGHVGGSASLHLHTGAEPDSVLLDEVPLTYSYASEIITLEVNGKGNLRIPLKEPEVIWVEETFSAALPETFSLA